MKRIVACALLIAWSGMASAVVYKWADAKGKVQYGDRPPDGVNATLVDLPGVRGNSSAADNPVTPPAQSGTKPAKSADTTPAATADPAAKVVAEDVAQAHEKQCADAQDRYKRLIESRRLYKVGADGERQYLTSEEIDSDRLNAKHDVDSLCGSSN